MDLREADPADAHWLGKTPAASFPEPRCGGKAPGAGALARNARRTLLPQAILLLLLARLWQQTARRTLCSGRGCWQSAPSGSRREMGPRASPFLERWGGGDSPPLVKDFAGL